MQRGRFGSMKNALLILSTCLFITACNGINPLNTAAFKAPYKKYVRSLELAELDKSAMAQEWIRAGESALRDSIIATVPFSESGYFDASKPVARSYRFDARKGQVLTINGNLIAKNKSVFLDLFAWTEKNEWTSLAHGDSTISLAYEFDSDHQCIVRLQPELLVTAYYSITISLTPVLVNPVAGATNKSIGSLYGDSRDGGKRKHEGVDIFAKKGTFVIAPAPGTITRVGTTTLGGKVIWMQDKRRGHSYYFAHLDKQLVKAGATVNKGDILGTVGNTGNARYTPAHLHFGIYQSRSLDPVHFIRTLEAAANVQPWDTTLREFDYKVAGKNVSLRTGPSDKNTIVYTLSKDTYVQVIAQSNVWYRVLLPNNKQGFVPKEKVAPIQKGKRLRIKQPVMILSEASVEAVPLAQLQAPATVEVLANFEIFRFVRTTDGVLGWLLM